MNEISLPWTLSQDAYFYGVVVLSPDPPVEGWIAINTKVSCRSRDETGFQLSSVINVSIANLNKYVYDLRSLRRLCEGEARIEDVDKCVGIYIKQEMGGDCAHVDCLAFYPDYSSDLQQNRVEIGDKQNRSPACAVSVAQAIVRIESLEEHLHGWSEYFRSFIN